MYYTVIYILYIKYIIKFNPHMAIFYMITYYCFLFQFL